MTTARRIIALDTYDIRFPTSRELDGSDAMNPDPDYSAAYLVLRTDAGDGLEGHGFTFTIGRGNDVQVAAINALRDHVIGRDVAAALPGSRRAQPRPDRRQPAALARPGEGRHAHGDRRRRQRRLGPGRQTRGKAAVEAARRRRPRLAGLAGRLPLHRRRADPPGRACPAVGAGSRASRNAKRHCCERRVSGLHHLAGLARLLRREADPAGPARRSPTASPRSS